MQVPIKIVIDEERLKSIVDKIISRRTSKIIKQTLKEHKLSDLVGASVHWQIRQFIEGEKLRKTYKEVSESNPSFS